MAAFNSYPPYHHHSTERISQSHALSLLSSYLAAAATEAYLHPNALLTESGPVTPSSGAHSMGLVLHNLKRVEAGLKGEQLGADLTFQRYGGEGLPDMLVASDGMPGKPSEGFDAPNASVGGLGGGGSGIVGDNKVEWQDKTEFDREQEVTQGEIGERDNTVGDVGDGYRVPDVEVTKSAADKERKRRKKARKLQQRRADDAKRKDKAATH